MKPFPAPSPSTSIQIRGAATRGNLWIPPLALLIAASTGCYHSTGIQRPPLVAEDIPPILGDQVGGYKASASPGDYYLGSDSIQLTVDGTPFGGQNPASGSAFGGSILDAGSVVLDRNFHRVSTPADRLERLTPVINQDPDRPLVFKTFQVTNTSSESAIVMGGGLYDPLHKTTGAAWDASNLVTGVSVTHRISLANLQNYATLTTTLTNTGASSLGITNLGDYLFQQGGGFRFNIPASKDYAGSQMSATDPGYGAHLLNTWGVDIPDSGPGTVFGNPYEAVVAPMVGLMGNEPSGDMDYHCSLGLLPVSDKHLLVTSDPQRSFTDPRPIPTPRLVVGSMPLPSATPSLAPGASITYTRRIYILGGNSTASGIGYYYQTIGQANQATGLFNAMAMDQYTLQAKEYGSALLRLYGTAQLAGPLQTEIRIERYLGTVDPMKEDETLDPDLAGQYLADDAPEHWELERTEWLEPQDLTSSSNYTPGALAPLLPAGDDTKRAYYRVSFRNRDNALPTAPPWIYVAPTNLTKVRIPMPLWIQSELAFQMNSPSYLCPEYLNVVEGGWSFTDPVSHKTTDHIGGTMTKADWGQVTLSARSSSDSGGSSWQPLRVTVFSEPTDENATPEQPNVPRVRILGGLFNSTSHMKDYASSGLGVNTFVGGNQAFGSSLNAKFWFKDGTYSLYGTRGPLSALYSQTLEVDWTKSSHLQDFVIYQDPLPAGWTSFDLPGPSQITTGGYLPLEKLSSALAEGIQVMANTELDRLTSASTMQADFRSEFEFAGTFDANRSAVQFDPFVIGARSSNLTGFGPATALFTPEPRNERFGGARDSSAWTLADFQAQAEGQFTIVHRPRANDAVNHTYGLFTIKNFTPSVVSDPASWWNAPGHNSMGRTNGQFDAIELLRGESWDAQNPDAWFSEFKQVRADWFGILSQQGPSKFTKALGLSAAKFSLDTPVGLARTYVKAQGFAAPKHMDGFYQGDMSKFQAALTAGAAVASTGPFVDATLTGADAKAVSPGGLVTGANAQVTLTVNLWSTDWVPVDELRVVINGVVTLLPMDQLVLAPEIPATATSPTIPADWRHYVASYTLTLPAKDAWVVVEAGVPLGTTGAYRPGTAWNRVMHGIYPIAVSNPIFVDVDGGGYTAPGL